jgi:pyruvate/2-oxoglutarate dehydrogenase complex dihydrolipoamide dehydrogenase (E3) component/uncharacterized membrane protein YdjX (TVP38/TMEM64 family)
MKKILLIVVIVAAVSAFFLFGLDELLTLPNIKARQVELLQLRDSAPLAISAVYFTLYVLVTALSLPGAVPLSLLGGAVFGLSWGFVLVSFASTLGATLAFLTARYILRDSVQARFGMRLAAINSGLEKEGAFYLFTLRLVPIFPFFLINLGMGLTPMPVWTYCWVSQLGMIPGTLVYINAGTELGRIEHLQGLLSPQLLFSFALLGIFPLVTKKVLDWWRRKNIYRGWQKPRHFDRNLIVIGGGAAGLVSSYIAATVKAKVTLVEAHKMGGDCLNYGCVPSKAFIKSSQVAHFQRRGSRYGLPDLQPQVSMREVMARVNAVISRVEPHDSVERYQQLGVEVLQGYATIIDPWTVEIRLHSGNTTRLTSRSIIIATGAGPIVPQIPGIDQSGYLTSETLWSALAERDTVPEKVIVLGGGPIGCELAQSFARLGAQVTQIDRGGRLLKKEDEDVSAIVAQSFEEDGVQLFTKTTTISCEREGEEQILVVDKGGVHHRLSYDLLLVAVGRQPRLTGFGLEKLGIPTGKTIDTNEYLQTIYPNIYAAGDVAGPYQFTHLSGHQAWYAAVNGLFGGLRKFRADYTIIPRTTFTDPEVARVGLNEQEAGDQGVRCEVTKFPLAELDRAIVDGGTTGFVKVLTVPGSDRILGVTIVGHQAGELLAEFVLAMKHGIGLKKILGTIHTYPTLAEANKYVAGEWQKRHAPTALLAWLERYHRWQRR